MNLSSTIEHTLLKPQASFQDIETLCQEAIKFNFAGVCVTPVYVEYAKSLLSETQVRCVSVVGFSSGSFLTETKKQEASQLVKNGADEIDMVLAVWAMKSQKYDLVENDIKEVVAAAKEANSNALVKVILETALLSEDEKKRACEICLKAGADFVKTSTGQFTGATVEDIKLIKSLVHDQAQIKASGGIKDYAFAQSLIQAGASRLGTSSGVALVQGQKVDPSSY